MTDNQVTNAIRDLVLRAISDDYESFEWVVGDVLGSAVELGMSADANAVLSALKNLINDGYAQAYLLSAHPGTNAEPVAFAENLLDDLWFYVTPSGKALIRSH